MQNTKITKVSRTIYLPKLTIKALEVIAEKENRSVTSLIENIIKKYLENQND